MKRCVILARSSDEKGVSINILLIHDKGVLRTRKVDDRQSIRIPVWEKYALTVKEAAEYYNIAETKLRDYLLANRDAPFVLKGGARLLVKRKMFEMFLDESNII